MCGSDKACGCGCDAKASRAPARSRRERDVVLTDREGRPFDRPRRADFRTESEYLDAYDDYRQRVMEAMSGRGMQLSLERDPAELEGPRKPRGFAALTPDQRRALSQKGGRAASAAGTAHRFTREEAGTAGKKGGNAPHVRRGRYLPRWSGGTSEELAAEEAENRHAIGVALREAREAAGISTHDLGRMTGLGHSLIHKSEIGEKGLSSSAMAKIAESLDALLCPDALGGCVMRFFERASHASVSLERDATYEQARRHAAFLDENARAYRVRRDPSKAPLIEGGLYYLEWDAHDEGDEGAYVYGGIYPQTGAGMFRRVARSPKQRVTLYLFPHEVRYLELLERPRTAGPRAWSGPRGVPAPPESAPRSRRAPELQPGRVLLRLKRNRVWDEGIVAPRVARAARFEGFRRIDGEMFAVWSVNDVLYAQPRGS